MNTFIGKSIYNGIAIGRMMFLKQEKKEVACIKVLDRQAEIDRYEAAKEVAREQLEVLYEKAKKILQDKDCFSE